MTPEQWRRVRDVFERVVDLPDAEAETALREQCLPAPVEAELRSLLATHSRAGAFLDAPATDRLDDWLAEAGRFAPGDLIGSYRIQRELGRGGMGHVYLATDQSLGRDVALKVLAPELVRDAAQRERLRREARAAALLTHAGVCTVFALEEIADEVVIASEFVDGETLRASIARGPLPSADDVGRTLRDLAAVLDAAHRRGIVHRDLKPENVMRTAGGDLKVLDFGLALVAEPVTGADTAHVTTPGTLVGTPAYMAPEQLTARPVDGRTDLFALGVLVYEYATGHHPFEAASPLARAARVLEGATTPLHERRPDVPSAVTRAVERCLEKRPDDRPRSAADLLAALTPDGPSAGQPAPPGSGPAWWRTHLRVVLALYVVAAVTGWVAKEWEHGLANAAFVVLAMALVAAGVLRGHLLFAEHTHDTDTFRRELRRTVPALDSLDLAVATLLVIDGLLVVRTRSVAGVLVMGLGVGLALARVVLERATTDTAFRATPESGVRHP